MMENNNEAKGLSHNPVIITMKRSVKLSKTHIALAIIIAAVGIFILAVSGVAATSSPSGNGLQAQPGFIVPLTALPTVILITPVILLYVYDKNNGMLEYFLSLGMTQEDIYKRYLKAALILAAIFLAGCALANIAAGVIIGINMSILLATVGLAVLIGLAVVSLLMMVMVTFSSLQRTRMGANQPLGLVAGFLMVIPDYIIPYIPPISLSMEIELAQAAIIGLIAIVMLLYSNKFINREKLLP